MQNRQKTIEEILNSFGKIKRQIFHHNCPRPKIDMTQSELHIFHLIKHHQGISLKEVAKQLAISPSAVTQIVNKLIKKDFLQKEQSTSDKRSIKLSLSEKSRKIGRKIKADVFKQFYPIFDSLSDEELVKYLELSKKLSNKTEENEKN